MYSFQFSIQKCSNLGHFVLFIELFDGLDFLLELHASILEPDFDLPFGEAKCMGHFDSPPPCQVVIGVELLFQFQRLITRVGLPASAP